MRQWVMAMEQFVHEQNLPHYRKLLTGTAHERDRQQILILLAEEAAKDPSPPGQAWAA
jgi:hypothetical protein